MHAAERRHHDMERDPVCRAGRPTVLMGLGCIVMLGGVALWLGTPIVVHGASPVPSVGPGPDPAHPPLEATVIATASFGCVRGGPPGDEPCFSDVDDRALDFSASFTGATLLSSTSYAQTGHASWSLRLLGTASGIGPGGSVGVEITARPSDLFRALGVRCVRLQSTTGPERQVPATLHENIASFEFAVGPEEDPPSYDCMFTFDPARLPRIPETPRHVPPTDAGAPRELSDAPPWPGLALSIALGVIAFGQTTRAVRASRRP